MSKLFYHVMQDNLGNLLFDVSGTMRLAGTGTLATIYGDEGLTVPIANPLTNHPSFGSFKCYLGPGLYDFYMAKSGYTFETLTGVQGAGTMAQQNANAVAITGGSAALASLTMTGLLYVPDRAGNDQTGLYVNLNAAGGTGRQALVCAGTAPSRFVGPVDFDASVGIGGAMVSSNNLTLRRVKASQNGLSFLPTGGDVGSAEILFNNAAGAGVGSISTTGSATAYNTSSDVRLKEFIQTLAGALDVIRVLRPVSFHWQADGSKGNGFLAHELMQTIPEAVSGLPDEVNLDGTIKPQQVDHSKLVVFLVGAVQELLKRVEVLEDLVTAP